MSSSTRKKKRRCDTFTSRARSRKKAKSSDHRHGATNVRNETDIVDIEENEWNLLTLSNEVIVDHLMKRLPAVSVLCFGQTCAKAKSLCLHSADSLWKDILNRDYNLDLLTKGPFSSFLDIYKHVYMSNLIWEDSRSKTIRNKSGALKVLKCSQYVWKLLRRNVVPDAYGYSFVTLPKELTKKIWGLKDDELDKISRYRGNVDRVFWGDAYDLAIKQDGISLRGFQDKILRRFSRGKGRLQKLFTVIVAHQRRTYLEKIRLKPKDLEIILGNRMPRKVPALTKGVHAGGINDDYVKGRLGFFARKQITEYCAFAMRIYGALVRNLQSDDIIDTIVLTWEEVKDFSNMSASTVDRSELLKSAVKFVNRIKKVKRWQKEKGVNYDECHGDTDAIKQSEFYRAYLKTGNEETFMALKHRFEGLEKLGKWMSSNEWISKLVDDQAIEIMKGSTPSSMRRTHTVQLNEEVKQFLSSGEEADFKRVLSTVVEISMTTALSYEQKLRNIQGQLQREDRRVWKFSHPICTEIDRLRTEFERDTDIEEDLLLGYKTPSPDRRSSSSFESDEDLGFYFFRRMSDLDTDSDFDSDLW